MKNVTRPGGAAEEPPALVTTRRRIAAAALGLAAGAVRGRPAAAQAPSEFPAAPVRVIVPFVPGGTTDALCRYVGQQLSQDWRQPVVIDNRPGGGSITGTELIARAAPDGYTFGMVVSAHTIQPAMTPKPPYDPVDDFSFITLVTRVPKVLMAHPSVPANDLRQLIALVRSRPDQFGSVSSSGHGSAAHLGIELLNTLTDARFTHVAYRGSGAANIDLINGTVPLSVGDINNALPLIRNSRAKAIAVLGDHRVPQLPGIGTLNEVFPGQSVYELYGFIGPRGMPARIVQKLWDDVRRVLSTPAARAQYTEELGIEFACAGPDEFRTAVREDVARWARVVREANIRFE